jgi:hypothetical protein
MSAEALARLDEEIREQWAKFERAREAGHYGAPLTRINQKLVRLEYERDALAERMREEGVV